MRDRGKSRFKHIVLDHLGQARNRLVLAALCTLGLIATQLLWPWPITIVIDQILLERPLSPSFSFLQGVLESDKVLAVTAVSLSIVLIALLRGGFPTRRSTLPRRLAIS